jgi:hypothetical protein
MEVPGFLNEISDIKNAFDPATRARGAGLQCGAGSRATRAACGQSQ